MKGIIALLFLLSVAVSLKAHSANHEAAFPFETWVNPNSGSYTCGCKYYFVWPRTMNDCPNCGGIPVTAGLTDGVAKCGATPDYKDMTCCWPTSQSDAILAKWRSWSLWFNQIIILQTSWIKQREFLYNFTASWTKINRYYPHYKRL